MHRLAFAIACILGIVIVSAASAQTIITQAKAVAGGITPGDTAGYPITISQPGAYRLDSNLTVPAAIYGIYITANNVDIDMNGFTLTGNGGGTYGLISSFGESRIHGGVINLFRNSGIYLRNNAWTVEDMQIVRNGNLGIDATGARYITVRKSLVAANSLTGIFAGQNLKVYDSTVSRNGKDGISCTVACHISDSVINENIGNAIITSSGFIHGNTIFDNGGYGVFDQSGTRDSGMTNNMLARNNDSGASQTSFTVEVHPNTCVGKPCVTPP
jgi:hypothetical protein